MKPAIVVTVLVALTSLASIACVPKSQYDAKTQEAQQQVDAAKQEGESMRQKLAQAQQQLADAQAQIAQLQGSVGLAESKAMTDEQKAQLEEARRALQDAQERGKLLDDLQTKFKKMIDAGNLKVITRHGRVVLQLRTDVLFDTGDAEVKAAGKQALSEVGTTLRGVGGKKFQVAGHTDNAPITTETKKKYPTNWELSAARAISVVKLLVADGVDPAVLSAAGYSLYDPVAPNTATEGQAKNRRIEITLVPNVAELVTGADKK